MPTILVTLVFAFRHEYDGTNWHASHPTRVGLPRGASSSDQSTRAGARICVPNWHASHAWGFRERATVLHRHTADTQSCTDTHNRHTVRQINPTRAHTQLKHTRSTRCPTRCPTHSTRCPTRCPTNKTRARTHTQISKVHVELHPSIVPSKDAVFPSSHPSSAVLTPSLHTETPVDMWHSFPCALSAPGCPS